MPLVSTVLRDPYARALLLFPTKALAQDQLGSLRAFADVACPHLYAATLDGDTSRPDRLQIAARCHAVLSNPDLLHATVLPQHADWSELLTNLKLVVVDEAHAYHGVFGSHVALVLRRLRRLAARYGASPRFICCSATLANPQEHMLRLTGIDVADMSVIESDAAPSGQRIIALWNPPPLAPSALTEWHERLPPGQAKRRASSLHEAATLLTLLLTHGLRTIAFVRTRAVAERLYEAVRDQLPESHRSGLAVYRAGYNKEKRREIERALFGGQLLGVVATTALELGVDVGSLDATLHLGYPGSTASLAQQAGRAGRSGRDALALVVAADNPLEQHLMRSPKGILERPVDRTVLDPHNPVILRQHLAAAALEAPIQVPAGARLALAELAEGRTAPTSGGTSGGPSGGNEPKPQVDEPKAELELELEVEPELELEVEPEPHLGRWSEWRGAAERALVARDLRIVDGSLRLLQGKVPAPVSLRDIDSRKVRLVVTPARPPAVGAYGGASGADGIFGEVGGGARGSGGTGRALLDRRDETELETMEESAAQLRVYDNAVYLHSGMSYIVDELDLHAREARMHREDVNYYTEPRDHTRVSILRRLGEKNVFGCTAWHGPMRVSKQVYGYRKCSKVSGRLLELCEAERPKLPFEYQTRGVWLDLPSGLRNALHASGESYARGGLHALEHLAIGLAPLCVTCEPTDLGCQCTRRTGDEHGDRFLIFERRRGGVGIADALLLGLPSLLEAALARLDSCTCGDEGCLSCIHMGGCGEYNEGLDKGAARKILRWLLLGEAPLETGALVKAEIDAASVAGGRVECTPETSEQDM